MFSLYPVNVLGSLVDAVPVPGWLVVAAILVLGLIVIGRGDVRRFSLYRARAIARVCFQESVRRRVLWLIPVTILGLLICCQLQKSIDEQDAIRQTTKFCLFATGLVVTMAAIILACTNLPREIENRVIFTIVTKPATRLELILGKIMGFAGVTALILGIMGAFTLGYTFIRAYSMGHEIAWRLDNDPNLSVIERQTLEHYKEQGLLSATAYDHPRQMQVFADAPSLKSPVRGFLGGNLQDVLIPFTVDNNRLFHSSQSDEVGPNFGAGQDGLIIGVRVRCQRYGNGPARSASDIVNQTTRPTTNELAPPLLSIDLLDHTQYTLVPVTAMQDPQKPTEKKANSAAIEVPASNLIAAKDANDVTTSQIDEATPVYVYVPPQQAEAIFKEPTVYVHFSGVSDGVEYFAYVQSAFIAIAPPFPEGMYAPPVLQGDTPPLPSQIGPGATPDGQAMMPIFRGRLALRGGQELSAADPVKNPKTAVAMYDFAHAAPDASLPDALFLVRANVNRNESEGQYDRDTPTAVTLTFRNHENGQLSEPYELKIENHQPAYLTAPAAAVGSGDFDVLLRCQTVGDSLGLSDSSVALIGAHQPFVWNLFKSLFITWLMTVLVITIAVFCSTFLSWPIAVVLTIVLVMGHWAVMQVADASDKTLGRSIATDMGLTDPSKSVVLVNSVNTLSSSLNILGTVLPDIDRFASIQDIEQGVIVSSARLADALGVLLAFAVPATVLSYVLLKKKEVAP